MKIKQGILALGPILLVLWLILGIVGGFEKATICMVLACAGAAFVYVWIDFITKHID